MAVRDLGIVTAYGYAKAGGYEGTEQEFTALLGDLAITVEDLEGMTVSTTTLAPGQPATASYADGVLSLGIPEGLPGVNGEVTNASLAETLADYAKIDGYYEDLTAGNAEQLLSTVQVEDQAPYLFRTSGGSTDIGNREIDKIVGGSIAWNQKVVKNGTTTTSSGVTFTCNGDGSWTVNGTATANTYVFVTAGHPGNHVYFCTTGKTSTDVTMWFAGYAGKFGNNVIHKPASTIGMTLYVETGKTVNNVTVYPQVFDLTAMFGSTIADYIYSLEQANAGSGVALFRSWFPKDYYAYNTGELMSVKTSAHEMVGFNQWDEEWENGTINNDTGQNVVNAEVIRSKNYIPVLPNTEYYLKVPVGACPLFFYDSEKNYITPYFGAKSNETFTTPANARYMRFRCGSNYGTTYNHDICINLSWSGWRNGEYEPYVKHTYPLDDIELRGVPKLVDGEIQYDGDTYEADGTVTRKYGIVDLGTLQWNKGATTFATSGISTLIRRPSNNGDVISTVCTKPMIMKSVAGVSGTVGTYECYVNSNGTLNWYYPLSDYADGLAFKAAMSGVYLVYELATPTTETADPYTNPQIVDDFGTERYVDEREVAVPVGHVTVYPANLRDKLQHLPDLASSDGAYLIRQTGNQMSLDLFRIPKAPTTDGTYVLKATVSGGTPTYTWEVEE